MHNASPYRPDIDGLRAIAILSVVAFHAGVPGISGGFVGVDVFFVISGYLITSLLINELERTGSINLPAFYARRIRRLLPALLLMVAVTLLIGLLVMFPLDLRRLGRSATAVMLILSNVHFLEFSGGYFDPSTDLMPLLHTWSLSIEEQYYLTWPLLILTFSRWVRSDRSAGLARINVRLLSLIMLSSFAASLFYLRDSKSEAFYLMHLRAWELALGGFAWQIQRYWNPSEIASRTLAAAGMLAIVASVVLIDENTRFPGVAALPPTLGAAAVLIGHRREFARSCSLRQLLTIRPMVSIGLLSYSWYLWHWPLLSLSRTYFLGERDMVRDVISVTVALIVAAVSYRFVERPIRYRQVPWFDTANKAIVMGVVSSFCVVLLASGVNHRGKALDSRLAQEAVKLTPAAEQPFGTDKCREPKDGIHLAPQAECILGDGNRNVGLVAWGDSHTGHLASMLEAYAAESQRGVLVRASKYCPPLLEALPYKKGEGLFPCASFNGGVVEEIEALAKSGAGGVVLASRWNVYLSLMPSDPGRTSSIALVPERDYSGMDADRFGAHIRLDPAFSANVMADSLQHTLTKFQRAGLRVLIVAPIPELYFSGPQCIYRKTEAECVVPRHRVDERRSLAMESIRKGAAGFDNVRILDPIDLFCDSKWCYTVRNGVLMYRDADHISGEMSRALLPLFKPHLDWLAEPRS